MNELRYFTREEFVCSETGEEDMKEGFLNALDALRGICNFPFHINSGYRSVNHTAEASKDEPGWHTKGLAADIRVNGGEQRYLLVQRALEMGFSGIGIGKTYVHLDLRSTDEMLWVY